jgi:hypothetical protein
LEVADRLVYLVCLREDYTKLVEDLALLVEVGRHLKDCDERRDRVFVRLELLVQNPDPVPQLRVLDVLQRVKRVLIGVEALLQVLDKELAVA